MPKTPAPVQKAPGGRPPKTFDRQSYFDVFYSVFTLEEMKAITIKLLELAKAGDRELLKYCFDRIQGRPGDGVGEGEGTKPVEVHIFLPKKNAKE